MTTGYLVWLILFFGLLFWLGCYLIARNPRRWLLWLTALALLSLAGVVALGLLNQLAFTARLALQLIRGAQLLILLSAFWGLAAMIMLAPNYRVWTHRLQTQKLPLVLAWLGLVGFAVGCGWLILAGMRLPSLAQLSLMAASLLVLGTAVAIMVAADQGEAWLSHYLRSFDYSFFTALLFGGQVALLIAYLGGITYPLLLLLLGTVASAILVQVLAGPVQTALDQVAFWGEPLLRRRRAALRAESEAMQLVDDSLDLLHMDDETFIGHTRRALSHMGDLPKLAASPLTNLPLVNERLGGNGRADSTLLRASELKLILTESINRLKPANDGDFGTTDAWRFYNALYFPYVKGIRPYSRRTIYADANGDEPTIKEALDWFRSQVPERTLYNWQNTAAQLVARDLRERSRAVPGASKSQIPAV